MSEENINNPFKNGDTAICICEQAHKMGLLTLGKEYEVLNADEHFVTVKDDEGQLERYNHERFVLKSNKKVVMEQTAERIREDILHIEKRIEEAKKDIASMDEQKNVLVEKLKEKGFVLVETLGVVQEVTDDVIKLGDKVRIVEYNEEYHDYDCTQQTAVVFEIDDSNRPYRVQVKPGVDFWCKKSEVEKI